MRRRLLAVAASAVVLAATAAPTASGGGPAAEPAPQAQATEGQAYDRAGNVTSESRSLPGVTAADAGGGTQSFAYDGLSRVTASTGLTTAHSYAYTYDRDGNRASQTAGGVPWAYAHDRTGELVSVQIAGQAAQSFAYDSRGNLTGDAETGAGVTAYAYDLGNRLVAIDAAGTANDAAYTHDALGRIRTRTVGASPSPATTDMYSYASTLPAVVRIATGAASLDSVVTPSEERLGAVAGGVVNWLLPDLHGSVAATLSADEATVTSATRYDAWGDTMATGSAGGTAVGVSAWKYQGRLDISPSGLDTPLYVMGARLYDPGIGAFTSLDTYSGRAQDPLSMNRFLYAAANPATLVDPTGHWFGLDNLVAGIAGAVIGGAMSAVSDIASGQGLQLDHVVAGAVGGAVGAEVALQTLNPVLAGAAGSAATNLTQQAINIVGSGGKVGFDPESLVKDTLVGAAMGAAGAAAGKAISALGSRVSLALGRLADDGPRLGPIGSPVAPNEGIPSGTWRQAVLESNREAGGAREAAFLDKASLADNEFLLSQRTVFDASGRRAIDASTGEGRRFDFVRLGVDGDGKLHVKEIYEVSSRNEFLRPSKIQQIAKGDRLMNGPGAYIKGPLGEHVPFLGGDWATTKVAL